MARCLDYNAKPPVDKIYKRVVKEWVLDVSKMPSQTRLSRLTVMFEKLELGVEQYLILALGIWTSILSLLTLRTIGRYNRLMRGANNLNFSQVLERIVKKQDLDGNDIQQILAKVAKIEIANQKNFQKYALVRFNPFEDTGGDQSFILAILNDQDSGIVISSLHSRENTRVYTKLVENGKATTHQFSKEEKEVVARAASDAARAAQHKS